MDARGQVQAEDNEAKSGRYRVHGCVQMLVLAVAVIVPFDRHNESELANEWAICERFVKCK